MRKNQIIFRLIKIARKTYRPELHYMRGPGPKWYAKHQGHIENDRTARQRLNKPGIRRPALQCDVLRRTEICASAEGFVVELPAHYETGLS